jgi:hypothetical protein
MTGTVIMVVCCIICAAIFITIGVWALKKDTPMHFWGGSTVPPEAIRDIPAYNRANGIMWILYGVLYAGAAVLSLFSVDAAGIAIAVFCLAGLPALILIYRRIYNKYRAG